MRNIITRIILFAFVLLLFSRCKKENSLSFTDPIDVRLNQTLDTYDSLLVNAPHGWKAVIKAGSGKGYTYAFYLRFGKDGFVTMYSDFDTSKASIIDRATYRLKAQQNPSLIFDTYSYITFLSDPNSSVNGGTSGQGLGADFEFSFLPATKNDSLVLLGNKKNSNMYLTLASVGDEAYFDAGMQSLFLKKIDSISLGNPYYYDLSLLVDYSVRFSYTAASRTVSLSYYDNASMKTSVDTSGCYAYGDTLFLVAPIERYGKTIDKIYWSNGDLYAVVDGSPESFKTSTDALGPSMITVFGYGKTYTTLRADTSTVGQSVGFKNAFKVADASLRTFSYNNTTGRYIQYITCDFSKADTMVLTIRYLNSAGTTYTLATFNYRYVFNGDIVSLTYIGPSGSWAPLIKSYVTALTEQYFGSSQFRVKWAKGYSYFSPTKIGSLIPVLSPDSYMNGLAN